MLRSAVKTIATQGLRASTVMIARYAGVAEGTLFLYFSTKDVLLSAVFEHLLQDLEASLASLPPRPVIATDRGIHLEPLYRLGRGQSRRVFHDQSVAGIGPTDGRTTAQSGNAVSPPGNPGLPTTLCRPDGPGSMGAFRRDGESHRRHDGAPGRGPAATCRGVQDGGIRHALGRGDAGRGPSGTQPARRRIFHARDPPFIHLKQFSLKVAAAYRGEPFMIRAKTLMSAWPRPPWSRHAPAMTTRHPRQRRLSRRRPRTSCSSWETAWASRRSPPPASTRSAKMAI